MREGRLVRFRTEPHGVIEFETKTGQDYGLTLFAE